MTAAGSPRGFASAVGAAAHTFAPELGDVVRLAGADGHHLARVRRLRTGEPLTVADARGRWRPYVVAGVSEGRLDLEATGAEHAEPEPRPGLAVAFAIGKGTKPERVVAGLTELGVDRIVPLVTARAVVRWDATQATAAVERLRRVAREAAAQCRRSRLPAVDDLTEPAALDPGALVVVGDPGGVAVSEVPVPAPGSWLVVVGAEGGLDPAERAVLARRPGAVEVAVGPHVLRTETAAVAVAAALAARRIDHPA